MRYGWRSLAIMMALTSSAAAGPVEDAADASQRGDYSAALALLRPIAEAGNAAAQDAEEAQVTRR